MNYILDRYNRRGYRRFNVNRGTNYAVTRLSENKEGEGIIRDISYNGLGVDICDTVNRAAHLVVEIRINGPKNNITVTGKIRWHKNYGDFASCGIKIDWISNEEAYAEYIKKLEAANTIH